MYCLLPEGQFVQLVDRAGAYVPAEHGLWTTAGFEHSEPAGQSVHEDWLPLFW
jgi:hypothetical protein